jgi:hypothetical protein
LFDLIEEEEMTSGGMSGAGIGFKIITGPMPRTFIGFFIIQLVCTAD